VKFQHRNNLKKNGKTVYKTSLKSPSALPSALEMRRLREKLDDDMDKIYRKDWRIPSTLEYNRLREAVGWGRMPVDVVSSSLKNSLASVCVSLEGQAVGCGRIVGDGGLAFYIQDVMVHPDHQRKGIRDQHVMAALVDYLKDNLPHHAHVGLMDSPGAEDSWQNTATSPAP
jgi:GNAT superfamily N-acetyltransferase